MATARSADNYGNPMPEVAAAGQSFIRDFVITIGAAIVINDTWKLGLLPGAKSGGKFILEEYFIDMPDVDTNGSPAVKWDLGDTDTAAKFVAASTKGQSAGIITPHNDGVAAALPVAYTADKDLILKCNTAPGTSVTSGTIKGWYRGHYEGVPSGL